MLYGGNSDLRTCSPSLFPGTHKKSLEVCCVVVIRWKSLEVCCVVEILTREPFFSPSLFSGMNNKSVEVYCMVEILT